jgi:hypothetical protein
METAFSFGLPPAVIAVAAVLGAILAAIIPTALYLYVEPRGRRQWAAAGDNPDTRRAPALVRLTAWLSFAVGQLAIPWLFVPVVCGVLLFLQLRLSFGRPVGMGVTVAVGIAGLVQSIVSLRLLPLGVRMLARDPKLASRARWHAMASAGVLGAMLALGWAIATIPSFVHPWLRAALVWTALRPVAAYAAVCLLHAALLGRCAGLLESEGKKR